MKTNRKKVGVLIASIVFLLCIPLQAVAVEGNPGSSQVGVGFAENKNGNLPITNRPSGYDNPGWREPRDYYSRYRGRLPQTGESQRFSQVIQMIGSVLCGLILLFLFLGRSKEEEESEYV